ncbi:MAG: OmpH family outer membrane protein [Bacteroidales bacterium]|nr:OmpH family outer membrane protein [Bacteroidales bacterium]
MEENKFDESAVTFEATETANVSAEAQPTPEPPTQSCECEKEKKCKCHCLPILNGILLVGLILIYIFHFTGIGAKGKSLTNADAKPPIATTDGGLKIAYINTDTLMAKYQYALDLQKEIEKYRTAKENSYKQQMAQFQKDYETYVKGGGENMTLSQQQAKEKELQERANRLQGLEAEYTQQIAEKTLTESEKMTKAVYNFIREYNAANQQFDLILSRSFSSSPILYGNEGMDITDEIVKGLNEEYKNVKAEK